MVYWSGVPTLVMPKATTRENVCIIAGPEFGECKGHLLLIHKALYGLCSSGLRWHE